MLNADDVRFPHRVIKSCTKDQLLLCFKTKQQLRRYKIIRISPLSPGYNN